MAPTEAQVQEKKVRMEQLCWEFFWLNGTMTRDFPGLTDTEKFDAVVKSLQIKRDMVKAEAEFVLLQRQREEWLKNKVGGSSSAHQQGPSFSSRELYGAARTRGFVRERN